MNDHNRWFKRWTAIYGGIALTGIVLAPVAIAVRDNPERRNYREQFDTLEQLKKIRSRDYFISRQFSQMYPCPDYCPEGPIQYMSNFYITMLAHERAKLKDLEESISSQKTMQAEKIE